MQLGYSHLHLMHIPSIMLYSHVAHLLAHNPLFIQHSLIWFPHEHIRVVIFVVVEGLLLVLLSGEPLMLKVWSWVGACLMGKAGHGQVSIDNWSLKVVLLTRSSEVIEDVDVVDLQRCQEEVFNIIFESAFFRFLIHQRFVDLIIEFNVRLSGVRAIGSWGFLRRLHIHWGLLYIQDFVWGCMLHDIRRVIALIVLILASRFWIGLIGTVFGRRGFNEWRLWRWGRLLQIWEIQFNIISFDIFELFIVLLVVMSIWLYLGSFGYNIIAMILWIFIFLLDFLHLIILL